MNRTVASLIYCASLLSAADKDETKALIQKACTKCHTLDSTYKQQNTRERWSAIVDDMVARGAELTDAEIEAIIDYLAENYGKRVTVGSAGH